MLLVVRKHEVIMQVAVLKWDWVSSSRVNFTCNVCISFMILGMVSEIKDFCKRKNINVNMRVGIHTGYVLCGVVGTRRYKVRVGTGLPAQCKCTCLCL